MQDSSKTLSLIDRDVTSPGSPKNTLYPSLDYQVNSISGMGTDIEKQRLTLLVSMIAKRKKIRDVTISKLEDLIVYCDNRVLDIGDECKLKCDPEAQRAASLWQKSILDLEREKLMEQKELFRDTLFLRNEWIKSLLTYTEEKKLSEVLQNIESKIDNDGA